MNQRLWLFIPRDSEKKLGKADVSNAAALILDLKESVTANRKDVARELVPQFFGDEGFIGRAAIYPAQAGITNEAFAPSVFALKHERRVIAAFEMSPGIGTVVLDSKMVDIPHLKQARNMLEMHRVYTTHSS
jgi:citrate lyase beta subunit